MMTMTILGALLYISALVLLKINSNALTMKDKKGQALMIPFSNRAHLIVNVIVAIFFWYIVGIVGLILLSLYLLDFKTKEEMLEMLQDIKEEKKYFRWRFNIFKFLSIEKLYKSSDTETRTLMLETLYNYMEWDKEELN